MAKKKAEKGLNLFTLVDEEGTEHKFEPLELFSVGKKNFALLKPQPSKENEAVLLKFTIDRAGEPKKFSNPTDAEFEAAMSALESDCGSDCECECDEHECDCGCEHEEPKKARKAARKQPKAAKKAARPAARTAAKKPSAKKAAAKRAPARKSARARA
jgi:uncharacterized protein YrzB (UPF0473 family)